MFERPEGQVWQAITRQGFQLLNTGWPDFLVLAPDGRPLVAVEVKGPGDELSYDQQVMHAALRGLGVEVHVLHTTQNGGIRRFVRELVARFRPKREPAPRPISEEEVLAWQEGLRRVGYPEPVFPPVEPDPVPAFSRCAEVV